MAEMAGVPAHRIDVSTSSIATGEPPLADLQNFAHEIFDTAREPLLVLDGALRVRSANTSFYRMFKVTAPETLNRLIYELGNGQWGLPALRTLLEEIIPASSFFGEFVLEHDFPIIGRRIMLLNARRLEPGLVLLAMEDVTDRRQSQHLLTQIEHAQDVVDTVREPLLILDGKLRVHSANRAFYQTFNVTAAETETRLIYELGNGQWNIPDLRTLLEDILPMSSVFNDYELEHDFPEIGRRIMLLNARQLRQGSHAELLVLAMEDVTERRRVETEIAKAKEAAETANRTKSLFLANMSHELRTPLNAILGFSEMLQDEAAERNLEEFGVDLQKITTAGRHLLGLINDILDLSKIEAGKMELHLEAFDVAALIAEVATTIERQAVKNGNTLDVLCPPDIGGRPEQGAAGVVQPRVERGQVHARRPHLRGGRTAARRR
jgi:signal transduction histidine kinase